MNHIRLPDGIGAPFNWKITYDFTDVDNGAGNTTLSSQVFPEGTGTCPAGTCFLEAGLNLTTAFDASDAAINSLLIEIGDTDTDRALTQTETAVDGTEILFKVSAASTMPFAFTTADGLDALWTVAGGANPTLAEITSGAAEIYLLVWDLNLLEAVV
jgi:hypothetical protein